MLCKRVAMLTRALNGLSVSKTVITVKSPKGLLLQAASYNPKPLKLNIKEPYIPDKNSEKTPEWQKTARYDRKLYGRYGSASGIDPVSLWPSHKQLESIIAEENEWHPPLEVMLKNIEAREKEETEKRLARYVITLKLTPLHPLSDTTAHSNCTMFHTLSAPVPLKYKASL